MLPRWLWWGGGGGGGGHILSFWSREPCSEGKSYFDRVTSLSSESVYLPFSLQVAFLPLYFYVVLEREIKLDAQEVPYENMSPTKQKYAFRACADSEGPDQTARCAVWSGPSQSANRIIWHCRLYQRRANARMKLCACAGWIWISAFCACSKTHLRLAWPIWGSIIVISLAHTASSVTQVWSITLLSIHHEWRVT